MFVKEKKEIIMEIEVDGHTINKTISFYINDARTKFYLFPKELGLTEQNKNDKFLYNLICFKENMTVFPIYTPIECTLDDLNALEGLKIPFLVSHQLTEKGENVEYIPLIEEVI